MALAPPGSALSRRRPERSQQASRKIGPDKDTPHVSAPMIVEYITDLELLGVL